MQPIPKIREIKRYKFERKEYLNTKEIEDVLTDKIGAIFSSNVLVLPPKSSLHILNNITDNKQELIKLLSVLIQIEEIEKEKEGI